ncbi:GyrI-like domain-containing protein [Cellulomonas soli]|uniref:GyrI-like small molecule binding domain-containing protein n=1 Tax=Cellulomonas soli TaxID=931535 RepID=A0A512PC57_9CELL|nr:GyrI-like domain-containing protein [Cellulomonas soli]NYI58370.1 hypothetical protein [Cellulomonas soli]GEP68791.1 hypothetical protein CSO01_15060 [Cellulomonas soli]
MSTKIDFRKVDRELYAPPADEWVQVEVPPLWFLAIDGHGDPNVAPAYAEALGALYAASYAVKFASKARYDRDYVVGPLEGLWWTDVDAPFADVPKSDWSWTVLIRQPDWMGVDEVTALLQETAAKKKLPLVATLRHELVDEGLSLQILHHGPYADEAPTLRRLHSEVIPERGLRERGLHHEIYLSDARRTAPEKLRTVLRQPVEPR